jgi:hypothetical protein
MRGVRIRRITDADVFAGPENDSFVLRVSTSADFVPESHPIGVQKLCRICTLECLITETFGSSFFQSGQAPGLTNLCCLEFHDPQGPGTDISKALDTLISAHKQLEILNIPNIGFDVAMSCPLLHRLQGLSYEGNWNEMLGDCKLLGRLQNLRSMTIPRICTCAAFVAPEPASCPHCRRDDPKPRRAPLRASMFVSITTGYLHRSQFQARAPPRCSTFAEMAQVSQERRCRAIDQSRCLHDPRDPDGAALAVGRRHHSLNPPKRPRNDKL